MNKDIRFGDLLKKELLYGHNNHNDGVERCMLVLVVEDDKGIVLFDNDMTEMRYKPGMKIILSPLSPWTKVA